METYSEGVYGEGYYSAVNNTENTKISSWGFSIDGHQFVFLSLGVHGTFVFDLSTGQWLEWNQEGSVGLGFRDGQIFNELCLMGDLEDGSVYSFVPDDIDDFYGRFLTLVTGGLQAKAREAIECFAVYLQANFSDETNRSVKLYVSDDNGVTWYEAGSVTPDDNTSELSWRSQGLIRFPGRLFQITDDGGLKSIDSMVAG